MTGFGGSGSQQKKKKGGNNKGAHYFNQAIECHRKGDTQKAKKLYLKAVECNFKDETLYSNLGVILKNDGDFLEAEKCYQYMLGINSSSSDAFSNLSSLAIARNEFSVALTFANKAINLNPRCDVANLNAGRALLELGEINQALAYTLKSLELNPDNPITLMNLGGIYRELGELDKALATTLKSIQFKPNNPIAQMNLGGIYKDLGDLNKSLSATLKSLELQPDNATALNNLVGFIDQLELNLASTTNAQKLYELLISLDNISHRQISTFFVQTFLPIIDDASKSDPIISAKNNALTTIAEDWCIIKSLTLLIPPHQKIEHFLTRFRKEVLSLAANRLKIPQKLKPLIQCLSIQCFLNEYVYAQSHEEVELVNQLIFRSRRDQDLFNKYLPIIASYKPIYQLNYNHDWLMDYSTDSEWGKALVQVQLEDPVEENRIKTTIESHLKTTDAVSVKVQDMYEENPYPRYCYANYTDKSLAQNIAKIIRIESTKQNLQFPKSLTSNYLEPKVLIAGCGTGNQVITSSRYKNAKITAIDLSSSSLAYALRKANYYKMDNIDFSRIDLLDIASLNKKFDIIECSGVLHHMENPAKGLSALNQQLKSGGYIKLGLYSDYARQDIKIARNKIKQLGLKSTIDNVRDFRQQILRGEFQDLTCLTNIGCDFYSISEFRDLCFHVQEHRFTTALLQELLAAEGLIFCGFMLPQAIKKAYFKQYPTDKYMTSLANWGDFEAQRPSTFGGMYQFWAHKPT